MSGWDFNSNEGGAKADFTKFAPGIARIRVLDDEPFMRWTHWLNQWKRSINCPGKGCPICEIRKQQKANKEPYTYAVAKRLAMNVMNYETNKVEIMEQGVGFFEDLRDVMNDIVDKGDTLADAIIKVKRRGTTKDDTSYRLDLDSIDKISGIELDALKSKTTDLSDYFKPNTVEQILRIVQGESWDDVMKQESNQEDEIEIEIK